MTTIKPLNGLIGGIGSQSIKVGSNQKRFGAALSREQGASKDSVPSKKSLSQSPIEPKTRDQDSKRGIRSVGYATDPVSGNKREIKTFHAPAATEVLSPHERSERIRAKTLARTLVSVAKPLGDAVKVRSFMIDRGRQTDLRENLAQLQDTMSYDSSLDDLEDIPARDVALVRGLFSLTSRQ